MVMFIKSGQIVEIGAIMTPMHLFCNSRFSDKIQSFIGKHKHSAHNSSKGKQTLSKEASMEGSKKASKNVVRKQVRASTQEKKSCFQS